MDKRNQGRFCIQFNTTDARHLQVIELLEAQGRRKSQFITEAVLHYANCTESPDIQVRQDPALLRKTVEAIVREFMKKETTAPTNADQEENLPQLEEMRLPNDSSLLSGPDAEIDDALFASIKESMSALRDTGNE